MLLLPMPMMLSLFSGVDDVDDGGVVGDGGVGVANHFLLMVVLLVVVGGGCGDVVVADAHAVVV